MHVKILQKLVFLLGLRSSGAQMVPPEQCATGVHAILIRGQGPGDHLNVMVSIQNLVLQLIPGSSSVALPYDHGGADHRTVAANGAILMQQYIRQYVACCPKSKIFLMGYSLVFSQAFFKPPEGGIVLMDGLCGTSSLWLYPISGLEPQFNRNIIAAASYGEETFMPMMPWNAGTCTDGVGLYPRVHPEWCAPWAPSLRSYCDEGDNACCLKNPPIENGAHFYYIFNYNMDLLHFIQRRMRETGPL